MLRFPDGAIAHLLSGVNDDGGWGYRGSTSSATEPTAVALLSLYAADAPSAARERAGQWLLGMQAADGGFPAAAGVDVVGWATGVALVALLRTGRTEAAQRAADWLVSTEVFTVAGPAAKPFGYNTALKGWAWTEGDFSFTEPTALALIGLKQSSHRSHPRVAAGEALLHDRFASAGAWNYGEPRVLGNDLPAQALPTALSLLALQDVPDEHTEAGLAWLCAQPVDEMAPLSFGYVANALVAWNRMDNVSPAAVAEQWKALPPTRHGMLETALFVLAASARERNALVFS